MAESNSSITEKLKALIAAFKALRDQLNFCNEFELAVREWFQATDPSATPGDYDPEKERKEVLVAAANFVAALDTAQQRLLPELRPHLEDAFDPEADRCISRYQTTNLNLRKGFLQILSKAEVKVWPRLFHNLRGSLETDLTDRFPAHVVTAWLGNSIAVANKHYLKVTDDPIAAATAPRVGQGVGTSLAESTALSGNDPKQKLDFLEENEKALVSKGAQVPPRGLEPLLPD